MSKLDRIIDKPQRLVAGVMCGTSRDGIDVALVEIAGCAEDSSFCSRYFCTVDFAPNISEQLHVMQDAESASVHELAALNSLLGEEFARAVLHAMDEAGIPLAELDLIGLHGVTISHQPPGIVHPPSDISLTSNILSPLKIAPRQSALGVGYPVSA